MISTDVKQKLKHVGSLIKKSQEYRLNIKLVNFRHEAWKSVVCDDQLTRPFSQISFATRGIT